MCSQHIIWGEYVSNKHSSVLLMNCSENCFSMHDLFWFPRLLYNMLRGGAGKGQGVKDTVSMKAAC